jgi:PKHD-type hydroxylase
MLGESRGRQRADGILPAGLTTGGGQKASICPGGAADVEEYRAKRRREEIYFLSPETGASAISSGMSAIHFDRPEAFTVEECARIVVLGEAVGLAPATVYGGSAPQVDTKVRDVATSHHPRTEATAWLHDRLDALFAEAAAALGVAVAPMTEPLQILRYDEGGHFRTWHSDAGLDARDRRLLSVSVELSPLADHDGGDLEIAPSVLGRRTLEQGGARFFLSRALHHVTPVTRGTRWALVNWTGGA